MTAEYSREKFAQAEAAKRDCVIVHPATNELFIDLDSEDACEQFKKAFKVFRRDVTYEGEDGFPWSIVIGKRIEPSPSGEPGHYHVYISLAATQSASSILAAP